MWSSLDDPKASHYNWLGQYALPTGLAMAFAALLQLQITAGFSATYLTRAYLMQIRTNTYRARYSSNVPAESEEGRQTWRLTTAIPLKAARILTRHVTHPTA